MPAFTATYTTRSGQTRQLTVQAADPTAARRQLRQRGIVPQSLSAATAGKAGKAGQQGGQSSLLSMDLNQLMEAKPGVREKALFANKMASLVDAGVPIVRGLGLMAEQQKLPMFKRALEAVSRDVNQGESLGAAMRRWPKVFDKLTIAMVEAGETGGVLDETLRRLASLLEGNARLQNQIKGALGYPTAVLIIAILVFLGMTVFLIPTFADIFDSLGAKLPPFTQMMLDLSSLLRSSFSLILVLGLVVFAWLFSRYYATHSGRRQVDRLILKVPLFGELIQKTATAQFCRSFSSLTRAGVPILLSLDIVHEIAGNTIIADCILFSKQDIQEGVQLSAALDKKKVFPDLAISMLSIGEETGQMDAMLSKVADFYEDEVEAVVKVLTSMLEPMMIVICGGIVGSILVAMYLPMFSVFDKIR
jgi:type IV pilus assembly protein PilC